MKTKPNCGKYYYKTKKNIFNNPVCIEECSFKKPIKIGSENCSRCEHYYVGGFDGITKGWIICGMLT